VATSTSHSPHRKSIAFLIASSVQSARFGTSVRSSPWMMNWIPRRRSKPFGASNLPLASTMGAVAIATAVGSAPSVRFMKCLTNGVG
jgi:hypothetical protein